MQPYFFPYIGYFQLVSAVDLFVIYDNIQYTKKGWINRNRMLLNGRDSTFSLPLKKDHDLLDIRDRAIAADFQASKFIAQLRGAYQKAPYLRQTMDLVEAVMQHGANNLFDFLHNSLVQTMSHLDLHTPIRISSEILIDHGLTSQDKVLAICQAVGADAYINAIGGKMLYAPDRFLKEGITLQFIQARPFHYQQFGAPFVAWLSIIDVLMFNSVETVLSVIQSDYDLIG